VDNWPASLPMPQMAGCSYAPQPNSIRTQMEAGVAKARRRFTAVPETVSFTLMLDRAQVQTLEDFVSITLQDTLPFIWKEFRKPDDGSNTAVYRLTKRPSYQPVGSGIHWYASLELELLTTFQGTFLLDIEGLST
jgi:hypothetical protein